MSEQELWNKFFETGNIEDYLLICRTRNQAEGKGPDETDR